MTMLLLMGVLMGQAEIADRLGVSRQRVQQLIARPDWPEPYETLAMGKVWLTEDIEQWISVHRTDIARSAPRKSDGPLGKRHGRTKPLPRSGTDEPPSARG